MRAFPVEKQEPPEPPNQSSKLTLHTPSIHKQGEGIFKRLSLAKLDYEVEETKNPAYELLRRKSLKLDDWPSHQDNT